MPDDVLKRLLDAEHEAEAMVASARAERERIVEDARREAHAREERFEAHVPEIHASHVKEAELRADRAIAELERQFETRRKELRRLAEEHEEDALRAALAFLTSAGSCD